MGSVPSVISAKGWGFKDVSFKVGQCACVFEAKTRAHDLMVAGYVRVQGKEFEFQRPYDNYVMENILFKISFPAEFHAQVGLMPHLRLRPHLTNEE